MKALVIYDSFFGNTEQIARAIGEALAPQGDVQTLKVDEVRPEHLQGLDLLIIGSPTRQFSPSPGVNKLVKDIHPNGLEGVKAAVFDTRFAMIEIEKTPVLNFFVGIFGLDAEPIAKKLKKKGAQLAAEAEGFIVDGVEGPLKNGEQERAADWARRIAAAI